MSKKKRIVLIDVETRHQVLIEGYKAKVVKKYETFLRKMNADVSSRLGRIDFDDYPRYTKRAIERMETVVQHVRDDLHDIQGQHYGVWREQMVDFADYETGFQTRAAKQMYGVEFTAPARAQLRSAVLHTPLTGIKMKGSGQGLFPFYKRWTDDTITKIEDTIRGGYYQGLTNQQIARTIRGTAASGYKDGMLAHSNRAMEALTRTAVQHAASVARAELFEENDDIIEGIQIVSTLDDRTTTICQALDGTILKSPDEAPGLPPYHIGCRTTFVYVLGGIYAGLSEGRTRIAKGADGSEIISGNQTYYDWLKTQPAEFQNAAIGAKRAKLLREGGLSATRFAELNLNRNFQPRTLEEMEAMEPVVFRDVFELNKKSDDGFDIITEAQRVELQQRSDGFYKNKLTEREIDSLKDYTVTGFNPLNAYLWDDTWEESDEMRMLVDNIDSAIAKVEPLKHNLTLFRADKAEHYAHIKVGGVFTYKAYMSTSTSHIVEEKFNKIALDSHKTPINLEINVPKGMRGLYIGSNTGNLEDENELLLARGLSLRLLARKSGILKLEVVK